MLNVVAIQGRLTHDPELKTTPNGVSVCSFRIACERSYRTTTDQLAVKRTEHQVEENIFALLDEDSDLVKLAPGDNPLKTEADSNVDNLQATVTFYPMYSGILPEVIA